MPIYDDTTVGLNRRVITAESACTTNSTASRDTDAARLCSPAMIGRMLATLNRFAGTSGSAGYGYPIRP